MKYPNRPRRPDSGNATGQVIAIDGGIVFGHPPLARLISHKKRARRAPFDACRARFDDTLRQPEVNRAVSGFTGPELFLRIRPVG